MPDMEHWSRVRKVFHFFGVWSRIRTIASLKGKQRLFLLVNGLVAGFYFLVGIIEFVIIGVQTPGDPHAIFSYSILAILAILLGLRQLKYWISI
jgi:hypothetical protein